MMEIPVRSVIDRVRQPEYTGDNRCIPCTVVNILIAAAFAAVGWVLSPILGSAVAAFSVAAIYFRGYLIPGTPTFTKRYFPESVLKYFDKAPENQRRDEELDLEAVLMDAGLVIPSEEDLKLDPSFRDVWYDRMEDVGTERSDVDQIAALLDVDPDMLSVEEVRDGFVVRSDGMRVGQWESRAAFIADMAAADVLGTRLADWPQYSVAQQTELMGALRLFIETCPSCGGVVQMEQEIKTSCCREIDIVATTCQTCEARLFETPFDAEAEPAPT